MLGFDPLGALALGDIGFILSVDVVITTEAEIFGFADTSALGADGSGDSKRKVKKKKRDDYHRKAYEAKIKRAVRKKKKSKKIKDYNEALLAEYETQKEIAHIKGMNLMRDYIKEMREIIIEQRRQEEEDIVVLLLAS